MQYWNREIQKRNITSENKQRIIKIFKRNRKMEKLRKWESEKLRTIRLQSLFAL